MNNTFVIIDSKNDLIHHGIKGQKWGVRRYQNPDGSLTDAGRRHYRKASGDRVYKELKKSIKTKRRELSENPFILNNRAIGPNSKKLIEQTRMNEKKYLDSKERKEWDKKVESLVEKETVMDPKEYDKQWEELKRQEPKKNYNDLGYAITYTKNGKVYANDFLNKGGKDLSIAYLKDLGYNEETANYFVEKMIKSNKTLGVI